MDFRVSLTSVRRLALAGGSVGGWLAAVIVAPTSMIMVNLLTAFLGGAILLNVVVDELDTQRHTRFGWFAVGLASYTALLIAVTHLTYVGAA